MNHKPLPLYPPKPRKRCPVCGETSYSSSGIHPQCAVHASDAKRVEKIKRSKRLKKERASIAGNSELKPWHRSCPRCKNMVHLRTAVCPCGHQFGGK